MTRITTCDGVELHVRDVGPRHGRPVVLLHGWTVGSELFERQLQSLPELGMRCIAPDRRGCGGSDKPSSGYDYDTLADDLATTLDHLDITGCTVVAHSLAGGEVVRYLNRHGAERVSALLLVAPTTPVVQPPEVVEAICTAMAADLPVFLDAGAAAFFGGVLHGDADATAPIDHTGEPTAELIPDARLVVVTGGPHGLPLTHPEQMQAEILAMGAHAAHGPSGGA